MIHKITIPPTNKKALKVISDLQEKKRALQKLMSDRKVLPEKK